jgi:hypothetical protein
MNRMGILFVMVSASLCFAAGVRGDPAGPVRAGAEPASAANPETSAVTPPFWVDLGISQSPCRECVRGCEASADLKP